MKCLDNELHLIFNFIDRDCDGLISTNDFKQVIQELLPHTNQHGSFIWALCSSSLINSMITAQLKSLMTFEAGLESKPWMTQNG